MEDCIILWLNGVKYLLDTLSASRVSSMLLLASVLPTSKRV